MDNKQKLKSKLNKKRDERTSGTAGGSDIDIMDMLKNVNNILQSNPQMVRQVSKAVESMMGNQELMESLKNQIQEQTRESNDDDEEPDASLKETTQ